MCEVEQARPEHDRQLSVDLTLVFARGALRARLAAQEKMHRALMELPEHERSHSQLGAIAREAMRLEALLDHDDDQPISAWYERIMAEMRDKDLNEDRVNALFDEAEWLFRLDKYSTISEEMREEFYRLNNAYFGVVDDDSAEVTPIPEPTTSAAEPLATSPRPSPADMPHQRPNHTVTPPADEASGWVLAPEQPKDQQTILKILADGEPHHIKELVLAVFKMTYVDKPIFYAFVDHVLKPLQTTGLVAYDPITHNYWLVSALDTADGSVVPTRKPRRRTVRLAHAPETPDDVARRARQAGIRPAPAGSSTSVNHRTARTGATA